MLIPMLPRAEALTAPAVREYLAWLAASEFAYHLDDDPSDCGFPAEVANTLAWNADQMFDQFDAQWLWGIYWPFCCDTPEPTSDQNGRA